MIPMSTPKPQSTTMSMSPEASVDNNSSVSLSDEDRATVTAADKLVADQQQGLGAFRERFLEEEAARIEKIRECRRSYIAVVGAMAAKHDIDLNEPGFAWSFDVSSLTFTKAPVPQ